MANPPVILDSIEKLRAWRNEQHKTAKSVGFVPTMGALHSGHASLIEKSAACADTTIVSIYVNPTQFGAGEDFASYPRKLEADLELIAASGGATVFAPTDEIMYPGGRAQWCTWVDVEGLTQGLCGGSRPHHFRGVTTIVTKLLNSIQPDQAFFGLKDYQQYRVISRMVADLNIPVDIVGCPIVRESDGLAMSSRNAYLSDSERAQALCLSQALRQASQLYASGERSVEKIRGAMLEVIKRQPDARVDYVELVDSETLQVSAESVDEKTLAALAVYVGTTRLIDNALLGGIL